ncbi:metal-dependent hydrolase, beta-lactamase superfamily III [Mycobacterium sp. JS623]|uniref:MBL fold metallo-hydrolase n=1 Tax=Mycobacterium sp. JS623 TaxID=212767 RepID=UPI0002A5B697|nr:metal-dependent hydrolase, beta-lactamase superfamily III [Mycobacterium sp. JS623]
MKVHHLNCGILYPLGCGEMVCHALLLETANGLVLIDSGFGTRDCADPPRRAGPSRYLIRPVLNAAEAAVNQVERLGFRPDDVRHIVLTHFDLDHIDGISDFQDAQIHITTAEALGALRAPTRGEKARFRRVQWAHRPKIVEHSPGGELWRGFATAKELDEVAPGVGHGDELPTRLDKLRVRQRNRLGGPQCRSHRKRQSRCRSKPYGTR